MLCLELLHLKLEKKYSPRAIKYNRLALYKAALVGQGRVEHQNGAHISNCIYTISLPSTDYEGRLLPFFPLLLTERTSTRHKKKNITMITVQEITWSSGWSAQ